MGCILCGGDESQFCESCESKEVKMRQKSGYTNISDKAWKVFNLFADNEGIGIETEDWEPWFTFFEAGYIIEKH